MAVHTPTGTFPDLDGTLAIGPLQIQSAGEVFSSAILIKSADGDKGLMCKLIDACDWLQKNIGTAAQATALAFADVTLTTTAKLKYASRALTRMMPMNGIVYSGTWGLVSLSSLVWESTSTSGVIHLPLYLPHGAVLDSVTLQYTGATGHAAFPGGAPTMPSLQIRSVTSSGGAGTLLGSTTDATATAAAYEVGHAITVSSIAHTVDAATNRYVAILSAEGGANWITGGHLVSLSVTCTVTSQSEY